MSYTIFFYRNVLNLTRFYRHDEIKYHGTDGNQRGSLSMNFYGESEYDSGNIEFWPWPNFRAVTHNALEAGTSCIEQINKIWFAYLVLQLLQHD